MIYGNEAVLAPAASPRHLAAAALTIALLVEASRLIHTPWLDAFRSTVTGALLLGRVFSTWNVLAYAAGIATSWDCETLVNYRRILRLGSGQT